MANAMLEDDFKTSHPDLVTLGQQDHHPDHQQQQIYCSDTDNDLDSSTMDRKPKASLSATSRTKSVDFAILPPPMKRTRVTSSTWTAKQVVDGKGSPEMTRLDFLFARIPMSRDFSTQLFSVLFWFLRFHI